MVPGIDFTNDPLLQGRLFSYIDTQLSRLGGANFHELPINKAVCPFHNFQRDGMHRQAIARGQVAYEPHSLNDGKEFRIDGGSTASSPSPRRSKRPSCAAAARPSTTTSRWRALFFNSQSTAPALGG